MKIKGNIGTRSTYKTRRYKNRKARRNVRAKLDTKAKRDATRERLYKRDGKICIHCGKFKSQVQRKILTIDHKIPVAKGGSGEDSNLQLLCAPCHRIKDDIPPDVAFPQFKKRKGKNYMAWAKRNLIELKKIKYLES